MKKVLVSAAFVCMAVGFSSCGQTLGCYEIKTTMDGQSESVFVYGTRSDINLVVDNANLAAKLMGGKVTKTKVAASQSDCAAKNIE